MNVAAYSWALECRSSSVTPRALVASSPTSSSNRWTSVSATIAPCLPRLTDSARVDADPTVASLAGLPFPPDVDGADLSPLFDDPNPVHAPKPNIAFSEYPRCAPPDAPWTPERKCGLKKDQPCASPQSCVNTPRTEFVVMGYSVRTPDWRYTEWAWWDGKRLVGDFSREAPGIELYSHRGDTESDFECGQFLVLLRWLLSR